MRDSELMTVPACPRCGLPCTHETTIGMRFCSNAHAWKAEDYPRVTGEPAPESTPPVPYDWNAPHEVAHDVTHGQCTACSLTVGVVGGFIPAKCSACGGVIAPVAITPITGAVPEYVVAEVAQAHALDPRARPHDAMIWLADENKRLADRLDARERESRDAFVAALIETMVLTGDDAEDAENHPNEVLLPTVAEWRNDRIALTARAEQSEREREWQPIETAPRDGTHILACDASRGYGERWTFSQAPPTVVHYWGNPGEEGYYTSVNELAPERTFNATHWMPLPAPPTSSSRGSADHA